MNGHSQRLNHSPFIKTHCVGKRSNLSRIHRKKFAGGTSGLEPHHLEFLAKIVFAMAAGVAPAAYHLWLDGDTLSHPEAGDSLSKRGNLPRHLVALGDGIFRKRVFTVIDMDIRAAHADAHDFDQYLTGLWLRDWNLPEFNDPGAVISCCSMPFPPQLFSQYHRGPPALMSMMLLLAVKSPVRMANFTWRVSSSRK